MENTMGKMTAVAISVSGNPASSPYRWQTSMDMTASPVVAKDFRLMIAVMRFNYRTMQVSQGDGTYNTYPSSHEYV